MKTNNNVFSSPSFGKKSAFYFEPSASHSLGKQNYIKDWNIAIEWLSEHESTNKSYLFQGP